MRRLLAALILLVVTAACKRAEEPMAGGKPLSHWRKEATQVSLMSFWNSTKDERRAEAFRRLSEIGEPAVPALVDLMRDHGIPISGDAFNALANLGPRAASAVPDLIEMLDEAPLGLRRRAAWLLGTIGPAAEPATPKLAALLRHPDARLRDVAARALGQIGASGLAELDSARASGDARMRAASMRGHAAGPTDPAVRREFIASGLADANPEVRMRAVELLMTARRDEAESLAEFLVQALNDADPQVNRAAHRALTMYLQRGGATPALLVAVLKGGDAEARADVAWRLGQDAGLRSAPGVPAAARSSPGDPAVVAALLEALNDSIPVVRIYAARALTRDVGAARDRGVRQLRRDLPLVDPIVRVRAARALWDVSRDVAEVRPAYESGLGDPGQWNRVETISAIADMGAAAAAFVPHLERLAAEDPSPEVRDRAEKLLHAMRRTPGH